MLWKSLSIAIIITIVAVAIILTIGQQRLDGAFDSFVETSFLSGPSPLLLVVVGRRRSADQMIGVRSRDGAA